MKMIMIMIYNIVRKCMFENVAGDFSLYTMVAYHTKE